MGHRAGQAGVLPTDEEHAEMGRWFTRRWIPVRAAFLPSASQAIRTRLRRKPISPTSCRRPFSMARPQPRREGGSVQPHRFPGMIPANGYPGPGPPPYQGWAVTDARSDRRRRRRRPQFVKESHELACASTRSIRPPGSWLRVTLSIAEPPAPSIGLDVWSQHRRYAQESMPD